MSPSRDNRTRGMLAEPVEGPVEGPLEELLGEPLDEGLLHEAPASPEHDDRGPRAHLHLVERQPRRRPDRRHLVLPAALAGLCSVAMGLVGLHVLMAENQFQMDKLEQQASAQQSTYERLRLTVAQLEAPSRIVSVAEGRLGMQSPGSVTYLPATSVATGHNRSGAGIGAGAAGPSAPEGDADWPSIKPLLSGSP